MSKRALAAAGFVVLVGGVAAWLSLRGPGQGAALRLADVVPADARATVWVDDVGGLFDALGRVGRRLEGAEELPQALGMALGLERATGQGVDAAGLVADSPAVAFVWQDALWAALAVHPGRGPQHMRRWLADRGFQVAPLGAADRGTWRVTRAGSPVAHVWAGGGVLLARAPLPQELVQALGRAKASGDKGAQAPADPPASDAQAEAAHAAWEAVDKAAPRAGPGLLHLRASLTKGDALRPAIRKQLGLASLLFGGMVDAVQGVDADLSLGGDTLELRVRLPSVPGASKDTAAYYDGFLSGPALELGGVLPDEVALWGRAHVNPKLLGMIPGFLRDRLLPKSLLGRLHPRFAGVDARNLLLDRLEGRVAVGLLGVDDALPLSPAQLRRVDLRKLVGWFAALTLQQPAHATALQAAMRGPDDVDVVLGAWHGWRATVGGVDVALLRKGNALLWISGKGELARFQRAASGRFPTLGKAAGSPLERAVAADQAGWIAFGSTTGRIARAARRRGVPDAFVRMVRGVAALAGAVTLDADGLALRVALRPRAVAAP